MDASLQLPFEFVQDMPKREKSRLAKFWEQFQKMKEANEKHGVLLPVSLAAKLSGVCTQRIYQLTESGKVLRVEIDGHVFVTENSLIAWLNAPDDPGGRPRKPVANLRDCAKAAIEYSREVRAESLSRLTKPKQ